MQYAAFLRAVNVAGTSLSMPALKALFERLGLQKPRTLLQSGNIVFETQKRRPADLELLLQRETEKQLKVRTEYFIRDDKELQRIVDGNPFVREARDDPGHLVVMFLKEAATQDNVSALQARITGHEVVRAGDRHLYITYPDGIGRSKLTNTVIEKALGTRGTARNWNTILKMHGVLSGAG
jgi:uncharacterized protein (DUF1697 family)